MEMCGYMQLLLASLLAVALALLYSAYLKFNQDYGIFYLVEQWPKTFCTTHDCRRPIPDSFTIHGLWPQSRDGGLAPINCCEPRRPDCVFNESIIDPLRRDLARVWPNLNLRKPNVEFWKSQWYKHGSCSLPDVGGRADYFRKAIKLYDTYNLANILRSSGIIDNGSDYRIDQIKNVIKNQTRWKVLIKCGTNDTANYLSEIIFCIKHDANSFENCKGRDKCKVGIKSVKFP